MPITIIPDTGANTIYINADTGRNIILSGISPTGENVFLSGFSKMAPHNSLDGLQGGVNNQYYHLTSDEYANLVTGLVIRPEDTGNFATTSYVNEVSGVLQGSIDTLFAATGSYVFDSETGIFYTRDNPSGFVTGQVIRPSDTGSFYPVSNPSGFITGVDLSDYSTTGHNHDDRYYTESEINSKLSNTGEWQEAYSWGNHSLVGYVTGQVIRPSDTGAFYASTNPSGFITGVDLSGYVTGDVVRPSDTGNFYTNDNPSGYITGISNIVYTTGDQLINGQKEFVGNSIFDQNIRVSGNITGDSAYLNQVSFDTTYVGGAIEEGQLRWNNTDGTLDLGMNGGDITMQIGQEMFIKVRNQSGSTITNGSAVYLSGRAGNRPLAHLAKSDLDSTSRVVGIATQDISSPDDGFVTDVGYVRGIKTNYTGTGIWGDTWNEGDILYVSKDVAGQITNIEPSAPHHSDRVGTVGIVHNNLGSILVSIDRHATLEELSDINGSSLTTDGQFPSWHQSSGYFDFDKNINDYYPISNPSGFITGVDLSGYVTGSVIRPSDTGAFYAASNPSGYITGVDLSSYATQSFTTGISGYLQGQITELEDNTGAYYLNTNPSGYITGINQKSFLTLIPTGVEETGISFSYTFSSVPRVFADFVLYSDTGYLVGIKNRTITGYTAVFSDIIEETGLYLQTLATLT